MTANRDEPRVNDQPLNGLLESVKPCVRRQGKHMLVDSSRLGGTLMLPQRWWHRKARKTVERSASFHDASRPDTPVHPKPHAIQTQAVPVGVDRCVGCVQRQALCSCTRGCSGQSSSSHRECCRCSCGLGSRRDCQRQLSSERAGTQRGMTMLHAVLRPCWRQ